MGHSCLEEAYDEDDACPNCSTLRPVHSPTESVVTEIPVYIRRFENGSGANAEAPRTNFDGYEGLQQLASPSSNDIDPEVTPPKSLSQASSDAQNASQLRELLTNALDSFTQLWITEGMKLQEEDRLALIEKTQRALSG